MALAALLAALALAAARAPEATAATCAAPSIGGTEQVGGTLEAKAGSCSDLFTPDVRLEWYRCSAATPASCTTRVKPAQSSPSAYTAAAADAGLRLGVKQVASGGLPPGSDEDWTFTGPIAAPPAQTPGGPGGPPPGPAAAPLLSPFPVVVIAGRLARRGARVTRLAIRGPAGSMVRVRCSGRGCPKRSARKRIGGKGVVRLRRFQTVLRYGIVLELVIAKPGYVGKFTSFQIRRRRPPLRTDLCVQPGATTPSACPA